MGRVDGAACPFPFSPGLSVQGAQRWELTFAREWGGGRQEWEGLPLWVLEDLQLTVPGEAGFVPHVAALRGYVTQAPRGSSICSAPLPCLQVQPPD